mgnify:CR=1 FL=1
MARNLGRTTCAFCNEPVKLEEEPRQIKPEEAGVYYHETVGYRFANASCTLCHAKYLAWFREPGSDEISDLSFRSTFDDEPGEMDLPKFTVERQQLPRRVIVKGRIMILEDATIIILRRRRGK